MDKIDKALKYRKVEIYSSLRPDFYQFWPNFTDFELYERSKRLPFHLATLLLKNNIARYCEILKNGRIELQRFCFLSNDEKRNKLRDVIEFVGISKDSSSAIARVPRHLFIRKELQAISYLNMSVPFSKECWVSMPGLVAIMLESMKTGIPNNNILEIGIGSGYHAACYLERFGLNINLSGYEANFTYAEFGKNNLSISGYSQVKVLHDVFTIDQLPKFSNHDIIITCAIQKEVADQLIEKFPTQARLQIPRAINESEFKKSNKFFKRKYGSYKHYLENWWKDYLCLSVYYKDSNSNIKTASNLYDLTFVPYYQGSPYEDSDIIYGNISDILDLL